MKKICSKCGIEKDATEFDKHCRRSDGLANHCKSCKGEYNRKYREDNSEKVREKDRKYYEANSEKVRESVRKWQEDNPEKVRAIRRACLAKARSELADSYVKHKLKWQFGIPAKEIDSDMVEAKRRELKYHRIYNQLTKDSK